METMHWGLGDVSSDGLPPLWSYQENAEDLKHRLLCTTLELESLRTTAKEELRKSEESINKLLQLVKVTTKERDDARDQLQLLLSYLQPETQKILPNSTTITESESLSGTLNPQSYASSPVDSFFETVTSSDDVANPLLLTDNSNTNSQFAISCHNNNSSCSSNSKYDHASAIIDRLAAKKPLPQKGKLLQSVMEAGPLLQTLMVAGPLPSWRNPPPLQPLQVPPLAIKCHGSPGINRTVQNGGPGFNTTSMVNLPNSPSMCMMKRQMILSTAGNNYNTCPLLASKRQKSH
ncbi:uncharacterized protein LOC109709033 [Ananas comosus]|uniref:Uncharacterized protein LOC109709033 n=1 Tax=Ananas comosus TaxID=4615 RepID=A0A199V4Z7_ANACO|nr:uncharacterized protein LOC109709033 [Ananas comosus]OAY72134.1 hypothetical protein ACMD2_02271 [Ananas comosus]